MKDTILYLFDMDGTIYLGDKVIDGSIEKIKHLRSLDKQICFLTNNSSRSIDECVVKLNGLGFTAKRDEVYTSGCATIEYLSKYHSKQKVFLLGTSALHKQFEEEGIILTEQSPDVVVVGYDTSLTYNNLCKAITYIAQGAKYIVTHADVNCPASPVYLPDVGSFMALIEKSCGRQPDVVCGKPYAPMADAIKTKYGVKAEKIAMVGDRLYTDMQFAINNGFKSILVLSGETSREEYERSGLSVDEVISSVADITP